MLLATMAVATWGSLSAQDNPALNTSTGGYKFSLDWLSKQMPEPAYDNRQGLGRENKFFIKDKNLSDASRQRIHVYGPNGFVEDLPTPVGLGSNFTTDEAGNFIVRLTDFGVEYYFKDPEIRIIKPDGSTSYDIVLPEDCPDARGDYWGFAEGDVTSAQGGKLMISSSQAYNIYVVEIKEGQLVGTYYVDLPLGFGQFSLGFSEEDYVSTWIDANGKRHYLAVQRTNNPIDITLDGTTATGKEIKIDSYVDYGTSNGANCFAMNGKNYIMFSISPNWGDGFVIAELGTDDNGNLDGTVNVVARHQLSYNFESDNTLFCNWLNAEPRDQNSVYVYQYYPNYEGGYMARYIFGLDNTPLEWIVNEGEEGQEYTVADDIWGIYIAEKEPKRVYAKDLGRHRTPSVIENGQIDYVRQWAALQGGDWDQSNWVLLDFKNEAEAQLFAAKCGDQFAVTTAKVIKGGTLTGKLTDKRNPTMQVTSYTAPTDENDYTENEYVTSNFMTPNVQTSPLEQYNKPFFYVQPKAQEFVHVNWATFDGHDAQPPHFSMPDGDGDNIAQLKGGFKVDWSLYPGTPQDDFVKDKSYDFHAIVRYDHVQSKSRLPRRAGGEVVEGDYTVFPLEGGVRVVTAVATVHAAADVLDVTYVSLAGMRSAEPFAGLNLVVTRYTDGTRSTVKRVY